MIENRRRWASRIRNRNYNHQQAGWGNPRDARKRSHRSTRKSWGQIKRILTIRDVVAARRNSSAVSIPRK